jgi:hypothetical protein
MNVEEEVGRLKEEIQRLGQQQPDGSYKVPLSCLTLIPSGATADLSHPRRRVSFFLCCAAISRMARARIPPLLSTLRAMCSMICTDQSSCVKLRWAIESTHGEAVADLMDFERSSCGAADG